MGSGFSKSLWSRVPFCRTQASACVVAMEVVNRLRTLTWSSALIRIYLAILQVQLKLYQTVDTQQLELFNIL